MVNNEHLFSFLTLIKLSTNIFLFLKFIPMIYYRLVDGVRQYTLQKEDAIPAHPAKFSPEDSYSKERIEIKIKNKIFPFDD